MDDIISEEEWKKTWLSLMKELKGVIERTKEQIEKRRYLWDGNETLKDETLRTYEFFEQNFLSDEGRVLFTILQEIENLIFPRVPSLKEALTTLLSSRSVTQREFQLLERILVDFLHPTGSPGVLSPLQLQILEIVAKELNDKFAKKKPLIIELDILKANLTNRRQFSSDVNIRHFLTQLGMIPTNNEEQFFKFSQDVWWALQETILKPQPNESTNTTNNRFRSNLPVLFNKTRLFAIFLAQRAVNRFSPDYVDEYFINSFCDLIAGSIIQVYLIPSREKITPDHVISNYPSLYLELCLALSKLIAFYFGGTYWLKAIFSSSKRKNYHLKSLGAMLGVIYSVNSGVFSLTDISLVKILQKYKIEIGAPTSNV